MTAVTWLLSPLVALLVALVLLWLFPQPQPDPHPYETDPFADDGEHVGRHRHPQDQEATVRLADSRLRL